MSSRKLKVSAWIGVGAGTAFLLAKVLGRPAVKARLTNSFNDASRRLDQRAGWSTLPTIGGLVTQIGVRNTLRAKDLFDTGVPAVSADHPLPAHPNVAVWRTPDGTSNDLKCPFMGSAGTRFGRNAKPEWTWQEPLPAVMTPSPRTVSRELMTREAFTPVTTLNLLTASWLQFEIRDWVSHGKSLKDNAWDIPLEPHDSWPEPEMKILEPINCSQSPRPTPSLHPDELQPASLPGVFRPVR